MKTSNLFPKDGTHAHCGGPIQLNQMDIVMALTNEIIRQHKEQGFPEPLVESYHMQAIIEGANRIVAAFQRQRIAARPCTGLQAWTKTDDTGLSSLFMAHVICNYGNRTYAHPADSSDFHRCILFLQAVPSAREKLHLMSAESKQWNALVEHWDELTALYEAKSEDLSLRLNQLLYPTHPGTTIGPTT